MKISTTVVFEAAHISVKLEAKVSDCKPMYKPKTINAKRAIINISCDN